MKTKKKLQVFISSTFVDMKEERQACVEAILKAGHIPAGMELFTANDKSQLEIIKRWINDSDMLVLLLGGRYGSIEATSGKSYTELEYRYAVESGKTVFAMIQSDESIIEKKQRLTNVPVVEVDRPAQYLEFKQFAQKKLCSFFEDAKDVKYELAQTINNLISEREFSGWVSGREVQDTLEFKIKYENAFQENELFKEQIANLKAQLEKNKTKFDKETSVDAPFNGLTFKQIKDTLQRKVINLPKKILSNSKGEYPFFELVDFYSNRLMGGVTNAATATDQEVWQFYNVAMPLVKYGIMEYVDVPPNVKWKKLKISSLGYKFLVLLEQDALKSKKKK